MTRKPSPLSPDARIEMMRHSLRCFGFGVTSAAPLILLPLVILIFANGGRETRFAAAVFTCVIPLISLPLSFMAAHNHRRAKTIARGEWNPAHEYQLWGGLLSSAGLFCSLVILLAAFVAASVFF